MSLFRKFNLDDYATLAMQVNSQYKLEVCVTWRIEPKKVYKYYFPLTNIFRALLRYKTAIKFYTTNLIPVHITLNLVCDDLLDSKVIIEDYINQLY